MLCHKCETAVEENGFCPICDSGMLGDHEDYSTTDDSNHIQNNSLSSNP